MKLYVKNMVSQRCKKFVEDELQRLKLEYRTVSLGLVVLKEDITIEQRTILKTDLFKSGFELLDDKKSILIEQIKNVIVEMVHYMDELPLVNYSSYISKRLGLDYTYLANIFSQIKGVTIQQFIIRHKIEKVKELLLCNQFTLTEISYKLNYSSVAHLSGQFKKVTGFTPSSFRRQEQVVRIDLENV